jgi:hypothetical protein
MPHIFWESKQNAVSVPNLTKRYLLCKTWSIASENLIDFRIPKNGYNFALEIVAFSVNHIRFGYRRRKLIMNKGSDNGHHRSRVIHVVDPARVPLFLVFWGSEEVSKTGIGICHYERIQGIWNFYLWYRVIIISFSFILTRMSCTIGILRFFRRESCPADWTFFRLRDSDAAFTLMAVPVPGTPGLPLDDICENIFHNCLNDCDAPFSLQFKGSWLQIYPVST